MKHTKVFVLKQHTPIIHFQHGEAGATLRPSELKAKLDSFIIKKLIGSTWMDEGKLTELKKERPELFRGRKKRDKDKYADHPALDYSLKVRAKNMIPLRGDRWPMYFANLGNDASNHKKVILHEEVHVHITATNGKVLELVMDHWCAFWAWTNMGTRQSKGYGSFYPHEGYLPYSAPQELRYHFHVDVSSKERVEAKQQELFRVIDLLYKTLRGGINYPHMPFYFKSLMFSYLNGQDPKRKWDKRWIKELLFTGGKETVNGQDKDFTPLLERQRSEIDVAIDDDQIGADEASQSFTENADDREPTLWRDVLGLSTEQAWRRPRDQGRNTFHHNHAITKRAPGSEERPEHPYKRLRSPLHFKPMAITNQRDSISHFVVYVSVIPEASEAFTEGPCTEANVNPYRQILGKRFNVTRSTENGEEKTKVFLFPKTFDLDSYLEHCIRPGLKTIENQMRTETHRNKADAILLAQIFEQLAGYPNK